MVAGENVYVMERAQEYAKCLPANESTIMLYLTAWESLCHYIFVLYQRAYRHFHRLRHFDRGAALVEIERAKKRQLSLAEQSCSCQKGYMLAQAWGRRQYMKGGPLGASQ